MPKPPRLRKRLSTRRDGDTWLDLLSMPSGDVFDNPIGAILGVILAIVFLVALVSVVFPLIALTAEALIVVVLFTAGAIGRLVFGRPWRIEARTIGTPHLEREVLVRGLRDSREAIDELAAAIASGR
jgi:hypothetical protein